MRSNRGVLGWTIQAADPACHVRSINRHYSPGGRGDGNAWTSRQADMRTGRDRHPLPLVFLHWVTAVLVLAQFGFAALNVLANEDRAALSEFALEAHLWLNLFMFALVAVRLGVKFSLPKPIALSDGPLLSAVKVSGQFGLYALLIVLAISGYLKVATLGHPISLFGIDFIPGLPVMPNTAASAQHVHTAALVALAMAVAAHSFFALFHEKLFGTPVIQRMWFKSDVTHSS